MVWQRMFDRFAKTTDRSARRNHKRRLLLERLGSRELMAADIGVISGVAFTDQAGDGLTPDDPRLAGVQVELYLDSNANGTLETTGTGADTLIGTDTTDSLASATPGQYLFEDLAPGDYFVVQQPSGTLEAPDPLLVTVTTGSQRVQAIDTFDQTMVSTILANSTDPTVTSVTGADEAIGDERDITVSLTSASGNVTLDIEPTTGLLTFGSSSATGVAILQYDGIDGTTTLSATGLGGVDLSGGDSRSGLNVRVSTQPVAGDSEIRIYTDANNFSTATVAYPASSDPGPAEIFVPFTSFTTGAGATGPADFTNVGAIEQEVDLELNQDVMISLVESIQPEVITANLANVELVTLAGQVFLDNSSGANEQNNGFREASEPGVAGVTVNLYQLADPAGTIDVSTATPLATTTTGANGTYTFADLTPGNYVVAVPASEVQAGEPLFGFANSTGNDPAPDPDNNIDDDDNGTTDTNNHVVSGVITLVANSEPTDDDDTDANTNTTLDFGFFPQIDLTIDKSVRTADSTTVAGGTVVFDIVVANAGPLDATGVVVSDTLPAGLTFDSVANASGTFTTTVNGSTVTVTMGTIPAGSTQSFQLIADLGATQTADVSNTATVQGNEVDIVAANNTSTAIVDVIESDLRIVKTDSSDPVNAGGELTYTITVFNDGPDAASGVVVTDMLPSGVTFVSGNVGGNASLVSFNQATGEVTATLGAIANAASASVEIVVTVGADSPSPLTNTATVTATPNSDPDPTNNETTEPTEVARVVDVAVTKTASATPVAGGSVTYTVVVANSGTGDARGVTVTDTLDALLTFDSLDAGTSGVTVTQSGQALTFTVGTLPAGESRTFTFVADIDSSATGTIDNAATVTTTDTDSNAANNSDDVGITVTQQYDLVIEKTVDLATAVPGNDQLVYTITVRHDTDSLSDATNVVVTDVLPAGLSGQVITATTADSTNFDTTTRTATVSFANLPVGETRTFTITADINGDATGTVVNPASVTAAGTDLDTANNSDSATTTLDPDFDVTITKTTTASNPGPGDTVTYTVGLTNAGPSTATGVILTDTIPSGLTFVSGTLDGQAATATGGTVTFPAITLANDATATATLTFTVANTASGQITNTASVAATGETVTTNNTASANVTVVPEVDLQVAKTVSAANAAPGSSLTYTVTVTNNGPSTATSIQAVDTLPSGVTFVSGSGPNGEALTVSNGQVTVDGGSLADDQSFTFTINATINAAATGQLVNSVSVTNAITEVNAANNTASATSTVVPNSSSITGVVFVDANGNNTLDTGETPQSGVTVQLTGTDVLGNTVSLTDVTGTDGIYAFEDLFAGTYQVQRVDSPANLISGGEQAGTGATATIDAIDNAFTQLALGANADATGFNFGLLDEPVSKRRFLASTVS